MVDVTVEELTVALLGGGREQVVKVSVGCGWWSE